MISLKQSLSMTQQLVVRNLLAPSHLLGSKNYFSLIYGHFEGRIRFRKTIPFVGKILTACKICTKMYVLLLLRKILFIRSLRSLEQ